MSSPQTPSGNTGDPTSSNPNPFLPRAVATPATANSAAPNAVPQTPFRSSRRRAEGRSRTMHFAECQDGNPAPPVSVLGALDVIDAEFANGHHARRDLVWKAGVTPRELTALDSGQMIALAMQLGGEEKSVACRPCQVGNPFLQCVGSRVGGNGMCAGCKFLANPDRCNYRDYLSGPVYTFL
ncbi:hypothetical protein KEM55_001795 [Ascosphaera atra]|nr:hypothetical protein KEM55_001795 [Ascosphaera atra]